MRFRSATIALLTFCFVAMLAPSITYAEEGKIKIGVLYDYEDFRNNDVGLSFFSSYGGLVLGYEKAQDDFWWAVNGKYKYGRLASEKVKVDIATAEGQGVIGKSFDMSGVLVKPFVGLGLSWEAQDGVGSNDFYATEYLLPVGVRVERNTGIGLLGLDLQFTYVLGREIYGTDEGHYWGRRFFDGSYNVEAGVYYEAPGVPVGFRPYFKYEKWQPTKYWSQVERKHIGFEAYLKF